MVKKAFRLLGAWAQSRRMALVCLLLFNILFFVIYSLFNVEWETGIYTAVFGDTLCFLFAALDLVRFAARQSALDKLSGRFPLGKLPAPCDSIEKGYQTVVNGLEAERMRMVTETEARQRDAEEYYTLWVHQVKTPLAALRLLLQQEEALPESSRRALELELFRVEQYAGMALQYQRLSSFHADLVFEEHRVEDLARRALKNMAPLFIAKNLSATIHPTQATVVSDEKWLVFVLEQVLSNAAKYTRKGGVEIFAEPGNILAVRDTGIGIPADELPRIFERGYTGQTGRMHRRATGLGLYLCHTVLQELGFSITVESIQGTGTTVRLHLGQHELEVE